MKTTSTFANTERPLPVMLFYRAADFAAAADAYVTMYGVRADGFALMFLLGRSFELALKAALRAHGVSGGTLRRKPYGHDLVALVSKSNEMGLMMVDPDLPDTRWGIEKLNEAYHSKELEYPNSGRASGPTGPLLRRLVHFAIHRAGLFTLRHEVRERLLSEHPPRPGITLGAIAAYERA